MGIVSPMNIGESSFNFKYILNSLKLCCTLEEMKQKIPKLNASYVKNRNVDYLPSNYFMIFKEKRNMSNFMRLP